MKKDKPDPDPKAPDTKEAEDKHIGTFEELLALGPKTVKAMRIGDGPWVECKGCSIDELREMPLASNKVQ